MSTIEELSKGYANRVIRSGYQLNEIKTITQEIHGLTYKSTDEYIPKSAKSQLLLLLLQELVGHGVVTKSADNTNYLDLVSYIVQQLQGLSR